MLRILLIGLGIYLLYRFVFHFIVPVSRAAGTMKKRMNEFQQQMNQRAQEFQQKTQPQQPQTAPKSGDYIEFEEVK
jgi:Sec-independent protein translocase protein TatA